MSIKKDILWRVGLVYLGVALFAIFVLIKIVYLQFIDDDRWKEQSSNTRIKNVKIQPHRGDIYADDMRLLASSVPYYEIRMDLLTPSITNSIFMNKIDSLAFCLSRLFKDRSKAEYKTILINARKQGNRYYLIKDDVDFTQLKKLRTFPIFNRGRYTGGLIVVDESLRQRPHRDLAARTIGYISKSENGNVVGIEGAFNSYLAGVEGVMRMQKLSGNIWMPLDELGEIEPQDGSSVVTTINIDIQDVAERALRRQLALNRAHHGCAVLMEVKTGEIKAIVNLTDTLGTYIEDYNYAVGESTEPGSTFKLPSLITALEDGYVSLEDTIDTGNGIYQYYDFTIHDDNFDKGGHGIITVKQVFEYSSNVGMAKIITRAYKKSPQKFVDRLYSMDLNKPLGLEIKGEGDPVIKYPGAKTWSGVSLATMSYGYEVRLTPLQILCFYNAIANDGKMVKPRFAKEIRNHGKIEKTFVTEVINPSICSKSTLKKARMLLEGVVDEGTARNLKNNYLKIAGKTGTTQIYNSKYGYKMDEKVSYQASFVGYFPADEPKYSCIVVINSPSADVYHGNRVAGPVFMEIADKVYATSIEMQKPINNTGWFFSSKDVELPYSKSGSLDDLSVALRKLDVKDKIEDRDAEWVVPEKKDDYVDLKAKKIINNLVPNVVSMGLKDAVYLLESMGLRVRVVGRGSIRNQSITPGTRIKRGDIIKLELTYTEG
jgi:cell division protein FtsI (penicillin-binding protein 3)